MKIIRIVSLAGLVLACTMLLSGVAVANEGICADSTYISSGGWVSKGYEKSLVNARSAVEKILKENQIKVVEKKDQIAAGLTQIKGESQTASYWVDINTIGGRFITVSVQSDPMNLTAAKKIQCDIESAL